MHMTYEDLEHVMSVLPQRPLKIDILTQCTAAKLDVRASAEELYVGKQHEALMRGVLKFRKTERCDWCRIHVVSAKHGFVHGEQTLDPYERTFTNRGLQYIRAQADELQLPSVAARWWRWSEPDLKVMLLGNEYLEACAFDWERPPTCPTVVMCSPSWAARIPQQLRDVSVVSLGNAEAKRYGFGLLWLKGRLAASLLGTLARDVRWAHEACEAE